MEMTSASICVTEGHTSACSGLLRANMAYAEFRSDTWDSDPM